MQILVLGSAAGGGVPQWNCNGAVSRAARAGLQSAPLRTQASIAVSADGKTVQIFISNYARSAGFKCRNKDLQCRTNIVYRDNAGYHLTIDNLPWGKASFTVKRYRISKTQNLQLVAEKSESGSSMKLSDSFPTDTVDLIVLERK